MWAVVAGAGEWPRWPEVATETAGDDYVGGEGGFAVNLGDDEDTSPSGGNTHVSPPLQESYQFADRDVYRPDMSFLTDQYTTPPLQAPVPSFGSPSYVFGAPAFPVTPAGVRSTPTPVHMHSFGAYAAESSPWAVRDQSEPEGPSEPEQRQQLKVLYYWLKIHVFLPDFAEVYNFIGSVFDPNTKGHVQKLKEMDPIDVETVLLLMRNLSVNLTSPNFEDHRKLLSSYQIDLEKENTDEMVNNLLDDEADHNAQFEWQHRSISG
ncbi:hypothetical protein DCAR_0310049 [Daucus carota subsp. sativus]|uniref:Uncharacterized protein n=1 Tax=Daucus carota subsp. sativus TaxID=79200 RepID=A0AAF0WM62_DAUCS|nr:PREDICTED: uncharacterized protein LOC108212042 [Daucus carota subsp. sativus]WOG90803.1 hypothetical protein DCAR_0310049 [Daucus carota subsp. sativus]